jgi:hypothetical protein
MERPENNGAVFALPTNLGNRSSRFPHSHRHDYDGIIPKTSRLKDTHSEGKVRRRRIPGLKSKTSGTPLRSCPRVRRVAQVSPLRPGILLVEVHQVPCYNPTSKQTVWGGRLDRRELANGRARSQLSTRTGARCWSEPVAPAGFGCESRRRGRPIRRRMGSGEEDRSGAILTNGKGACAE